MSNVVDELKDKIRKTNNETERMRLALEFFAKQSNWRREPIGWGEDYANIDDGIEIATAALRQS